MNEQLINQTFPNMHKLIMKKNKSGENFRFALYTVALSIIITIGAFMSEGDKTTGFSISTADSFDAPSQSALIELNSFSSLSILSSGNYYVDNRGIVYWIDDNSKPAVARIYIIHDSEKDIQIYIAEDGSIIHR